jgi:hypothetical protein
MPLTKLLQEGLPAAAPQSKAYIIRFSSLLHIKETKSNYQHSCFSIISSLLNNYLSYKLTSQLLNLRHRLSYKLKCYCVEHKYKSRRDTRNFCLYLSQDEYIFQLSIDNMLPSES